MLRKLYDRMLRLAARRDAIVWLAGIAFAESCVLPVPPDPLLLAMALARPDRAWRLAGIATAASVAGGLLGYGIGYAAFDWLGEPLLRMFHYQAGFERFRSLIGAYGFWIILAKGLTPIPFKIVTIGSGVLHYDIGLFVLASIITRGGRFLVIAGLPRLLGDRGRVFIERRLALVLSGATALMVLGFLMLAYL